MSNIKDIDISDVMAKALDDLERIEFDFTVKVAEGISCKGTIFVRRNPVNDDNE